MRLAGKEGLLAGKRDYIVNPAAAHAPVVAFQVGKKPIAALGIVLPRSFVTAHMSTQETKAKQKESTAAYVLPSLDVKHPKTNHTPKLRSTTAAQRTINTWSVALVGIKLPREHAAVAVVKDALAVQRVVLPLAFVTRAVDEGVHSFAVTEVAQPRAAIHFAVLERHHAWAQR